MTPGPAPQKPGLAERPALPSLLWSPHHNPPRPHLASTSSQSAITPESASAVFSPDPSTSSSAAAAAADGSPSTVVGQGVGSSSPSSSAVSLDGTAWPSRPEAAAAATSTPPPDDADLSERLRDQLKHNGKRAARAQSSTTMLRKAQQVPSEPQDVTQQLASASDPTNAPARKYFILTGAGKPVYATGHEPADEDTVTAAIGVVQVLISIFADDGGDKLRYIDAGPVRVAFLLRAPLYLACVSSWGEPESILRTHLEYLHLQILSVVPEPHLHRLFHQRYNFDLRRMLEGTEVMLDHLVHSLQHNFSLTTASLQVLSLDQKLREEIGDLLTPSDKPSPTLLYALILCRGRVVTLLRPKKHSVHPSDLHILLNTIFSSPSLVAPGSESWIPICLPRFNAGTILHALVSFIHKDLGIVMVSSDKEEFFALKEWKDAVTQQITNSYILKPLLQAADSDGYTLEDVGVQGCRHFLYKSKSTVQITSPQWQGIYEEARHRCRLTTLYQKIYDLLHSKPPASGQGRQPAKLVYLQTADEGVLGYSTSTFELYLALSPIMPKTAVISVAHGVLRWIQSREKELFLVSAPSF